MPTHFEEMFALSYEAGQNHVFGALFTHVPMADVVNGSAVVDTTRQSRSVTAILDLDDAESSLSNLVDGRMNRRPSMSAPGAILDVPQSIGEVRRGDIFVEVATGKRWRVETPDPDDAGRYNCRVNRL